MLRLEITFLAGRYHATPWGRHVNEGVVEWPPSPWRLLRTLIAVGYAKLGWTEIPTNARVLLERLASAAPTYWLPPASAAHTRHYMPANEGRKVRSDKVLDAFADVGRRESLGVVWDVDLDAASEALLSELIRGVSYLGRAESWVEVERVESTRETGRTACVISDAPVHGHERVPLLAPLEAGTYSAWRDGELARARVEALTQAHRSAEEKGKKAPAKLAAREEAKLAAPYPATVIDALRMDTAALRSFGWSQPPGSRWLSYWRVSDALTARSPVAGQRTAREAPTMALLAVASDTINGNRLPPFTDAVLRLDALHDALVRRSDTGEGSSWCFTGRSDGNDVKGHQHAELIPLCLDGRDAADANGRDLRRIDHVLVHCRGGFDADAIHALRTVTTAHAKDFKYFITLVGMSVDSLANAARRRAEHDELAKTIPLVTASRQWVSWTPFVPPRFLKARGNNDLSGQIVAELTSRGFPVPQRVEVETIDALHAAIWVEASGRPAPSARYRNHRRERVDVRRRAPQRVGYHVRLTFEGEVKGPIALGYASHFGLGVFEPVGLTRGRRGSR